MKRLLGLLGLTCLVVLTACFYLGAAFSVYIGGTALLLFIVSLFIPGLRAEKTVPVALFTALLAVSVFLGYTNFYAEPVRNKYNEKEVTVTGTLVSEEVRTYGYYDYELKVKSVDGESADFAMVLHSGQPLYIEPYDEITFPCKLISTSRGDYASRKIFFQSYVYDDLDAKVDKPDSRPLMYHILSLRKNLRTSLYLEMDYDTASFSNAVLLGDKYAVSAQVKELFRLNGLSHIAVVSGLHLSIIAFICRRLFEKLFKNTIVSGAATIVAILFFAALTGFGVSVIRAAVMLCIYIIGTMLGRVADSLNSIGAAALVLLIANPYAVGDVGMLLSFAATLGIVLWCKKITVPVMCAIYSGPLGKSEILCDILKVVVETATCSICATIWTMPVAVFAFGGFSLVSVLTNLLVVPLMFVVLYCIILCVITHYIGFLSVLCDALSYMVSLYYNYVIAVCEFFSKLPFAYIYTDKLYFYIWIIISLILVFVASIVRRRFVNVLCVLLSLLFVFTSASIYRYTNRNTVSFYVPDTGSGLSVIIESNDGYAVVCAGGTKNRSYILSNKIDTLSPMGSNVLVDSNGRNSQIYCRNLADEFDYDKVLRYHNNRSDSFVTDEFAEDENSFSGIYNLNLWNKVQVTFIPVEEDVFEYITVGNESVLIIPRGADCENLPAEYRTADYLVADGRVSSADVLTFETLVIAWEEDEDESLILLSRNAETVIKGSDVNFEIDIY